MRILLKRNNMASVYEIIYIGFSDDIDNNFIPGIEIKTIDEQWLYVKGFSKETANQICENVLKTGYVDLTKYEEYREYEEI